MSAGERHTTGAPLVLALCALLDLTAGELTNKEHRTHGSLALKNELSCYQCDTMEDNEKCSNLATGNKSLMLKKCHGDKRLCMVKSFSYTTSTENSTSMLRLWALQRNCTGRCEPGCIVIGERTKLYACTACCSTNGCNNGKGAAPILSFPTLLHLLINSSILFLIAQT